MISQYKNIERLRYRISKDIAEASKTTDNVLTRVVEAVFSTVFSYFLTNLSIPFLEGSEDCSKAPPHWLLTLIIGVLLFLLFFVLSYFLIRWIIKVYKKVKIVGKNKDDGIEGKRRATKDFDNIALDSMMLVDEYIAHYPKSSTELKNDPKKKFYLYEIIHYILTSCRFAMPILDKSCIVSLGEEKSYYVEEYRFVNYLELLEKQIDFIDKDKTEGFKEFIKKDKLLESRYNDILEKYAGLKEHFNNK